MQYYLMCTHYQRKHGGHVDLSKPGCQPGCANASNTSATHESQTKNDVSVSTARVSTAHTPVSGQPCPDFPVIKLSGVRTGCE